MKLLLINSVCGIGSTGKIVARIADEYISQGNEARIAYGRSDVVPEEYLPISYRIGSAWDLNLHALSSRLFDNHGFGSRLATKKFLNWASKYNPDILWLHNLHGYYINVEMLFAWIKSRPQMQVKWTLHDCWAFTGHCTYFDYCGCNKWKTQCKNCPQIHKYPTSLLTDNSERNYMRKKKLFVGVKYMELITPSLWLASLVKESFLKYQVSVVRNTIDTSVFKPTSSEFRLKHKLLSKRIILGVASAWNERKGFCDFLKLRSLLNAQYEIVLVGLNEKQIKNLPVGITGLRRTKSPEELSEIYTSADIFFNPTYEDNFPTVNLEAEACGTPVVTYNTGGSSETIRLAKSVVIPRGNIELASHVIKSFDYYENCSH